MAQRTITLRLHHKRNNPRNSEGSFATLADGGVMFAYTRYNGKSWADAAAADICARYSSDGGRTDQAGPGSREERRCMQRHERLASSTAG